MAKVLVVLESFEQGMERKEGGALKLFKTERGGQPPYPVEQTEHGLHITVGGRVRTLPAEQAERLTGAGLIRVDELTG
jgi:hypothetical protein